MEKFYEISRKKEEEILTEFKTSKEGLSEDEAKKRLKQYGLNEVVSFKIDLLEIIKRNSFNFFNLFLFFAGFLSFLIKGPEVETILIFFFLFLSILISTYQDYRSNKLSEELLSYFENYAFVKRNGKWRKINAKEIVPGDLVKVSAGYLIPADLIILKAEDAIVDESIITGESEPIVKYPQTNIDEASRYRDISTQGNINNSYSKNLSNKSSQNLPKDYIHKYIIPENIALMGTTLVKGQIEGIVFATGKETYFGRVAKKTLEIKKETAYQKIANDFAKNIGFISIFVVLAVIIINLLKPNYSNFQELIIFAIVLAVAIVPEFLPTMTVLTLSLAGNKLAKRGLVIKRLSSIEDLGAIEILCTDKTGTITTNELKLKKIIAHNEEEFIKYFLADYYFTQEITPYEKAIIDSQIYTDRIELDKNDIFNSIYKNFEFIEYFEFDPVQRIKKMIVKENNEEIEIIKGAPENVLIYLYPSTNLEMQQINVDENQQNGSIVNYWLNIFENEDKNGFRTLALGIKKQRERRFLGIASFFDPLKETAYPAIQLAKSLNLEIKILTGDSLNVAKRTALELGLIDEKEKVILGEEIRNLPEDEARKIIKETKVFARVLPEDKLKIIEILQKDKFVGFLGEGINDAPALKIANVALAVDTASDVVKQEADIILKEKDLKTIVEGIYEGRKVLENIGKYIKHTMSDNFGNLTSVAVLTSILPFVPMTPLQVLLTNFLTDIPLIAFAGDNVKIKEVKKPLKMSSKHLILLLLILGIIAGLVNIFAYLIVRKEPKEIIQTFIFFITTMTGLIVSFLIRTKDWFIFSKPAKAFTLSSVLGIILTIIFVFLSPFKEIFSFASLNLKLIFYSLILILIFILGTEIVKKIFYNKFPDVI